MAASVESMGGTTLEMIMPSTVAMSRPAGENKLRSRMPHSSAVCSWTVRSRHCETSRRPSNAPMVMLLLPASRASSTYASCKDQSLGAVVAAQAEEAVAGQPGGGSVNVPAGFMDHDAAARRVGRSMGEERENLVGSQQRVGLDRCEQRVEQLVAIDRNELLDALLASVESYTLLAPDEILTLFTHASSYAAGRRVVVHEPGGDVHGTTAGLTGDGFLRLRRDDGTETLILAGGVRAAGS